MTNENRRDASLQRSRDVRQCDTDVPKRPGARRVIAVIGIDRYRCWRPLCNAVNDARAVRDVFLRLGFAERTEALFDEAATAQAMRRMVDDLRSLGEIDSLVVFYAGHGGTFPRRCDRPDDLAGYLIPVDADSAPGRLASWIELDPWLGSLAGIRARHILVILDACHSGIALSPSLSRARQSSAGRALPALAVRKSRLVITSTLHDERALDHGPLHGHSPFTGCLIEALTGGLPGEPDTRGRRVVTGSELGAYLQHRVRSYTAQQMPDCGGFHDDERGEMVIPLLAPAAAPRLLKSMQRMAVHMNANNDGASSGTLALIAAVVILIALGVGTYFCLPCRHLGGSLMDGIAIAPLLPSVVSDETMKPLSVKPL